MKNKKHGCYVSCAGGLQNLVNNSELLCVSTAMTHPAPPQRWNSQTFSLEVVEKFKKRKSDTTLLDNVFFHGIYLINLANPDKQKFHLSKLSVQNHLRLLIQIEGKGIVFHPGSFKDTNEEDGFEQISKGINWIFDNLDIQPNGKQLLLECSAGSGRVVGSKFEDLAKIYSGIRQEYHKYVGFCLDTQHIFASGYDIVNNLESVLENVNNVLGVENVKLIHLNDSKVPLGSNKDRHENLGDGLIGLEAIKKIVNHPMLKDNFFVMETPALDTIEGAKLELAKLDSITN